jgi:hypothetical protein
MKSTPARMLHQDQLLVDRYAVNKINKVEFRSRRTPWQWN